MPCHAYLEKPATAHGAATHGDQVTHVLELPRTSTSCQHKLTALKDTLALDILGRHTTHRIGCLRHG